uniref:Uncharacterized protein n=1 Tax=Oryza punctata TaxID=4537 RepID=A0A1V1H0N2_ORYPU|nr:hypothetical protein [Oryza punctata]
MAGGGSGDTILGSGYGYSDGVASWGSGSVGHGSGWGESTGGCDDNDGSGGVSCSELGRQWG